MEVLSIITQNSWVVGVIFVLWRFGRKLEDIFGVVLLLLITKTMTNEEHDISISCNGTCLDIKKSESSQRKLNRQ